MKHTKSIPIIDLPVFTSLSLLDTIRGPAIAKPSNATNNPILEINTFSAYFNF